VKHETKRWTLHQYPGSSALLDFDGGIKIRAELDQRTLFLFHSPQQLDAHGKPE
jgi:hypothetical protein